MNIFALEIWDDEGAKCTFYTVKQDGEESNETDLFFEKYDAMAAYKEANQELLSFVISIPFSFSDFSVEIFLLVIVSSAALLNLLFSNPSAIALPRLPPPIIAIFLPIYPVFIKIQFVYNE